MRKSYDLSTFSPKKSEIDDKNDIKTDNSIYDDNDTDIFEQIDPEIELKRNLRVPDNERITIPKLTKYEKKCKR